MRQAAWVAVGLLALAIALSIIGRLVDVEAILFLAGLGLLAAAVAGVLAIPPVARLRDRVPPMPGLFPKLAGQRWCATCGHAAPRQQPCPVCSTPPRTQPRGRIAIKARDNG